VSGSPAPEREPASSAPVPPPAPSLRADAVAGLTVFLVALPLCLGIALASGAPLVGGLIAGVVGGLVVGVLSGSEVSVSGPAAGLTVLVAAAIAQLGSYEAFLAAVVVSGAIQLALAALRLGMIAHYVPTTVIKGMLAAIGLVIVLKQIPHALGRDSDFEGDFGFLEPGGSENSLSAIAKAVASASPGAVVVAVASLALLLVWDKVVLPKVPRLRVLPSPLLVVLLGVGLNELFRVVAPALTLQRADGHLVSLPESFAELRAQVATPRWSALTDAHVYTAGGTIAIVGSLESLLSLEASQKLDPRRRYASPSRELFAQGAGNIASGLLGGLPVTSVVVRTSANVYAGSQSRWSTIFHAGLLGAAVVALPSVLSRVPLASLAAVLLVVGAKLSPPSLYREMWKQGSSVCLPFLVTVAAIVFTDLLKGVLVGIGVAALLAMRTHRRAAMTLEHDEGRYLLRFHSDLTFLHKAKLKSALSSIPSRASLVIDATQAFHLDSDVLDVIEDFIASSPEKQIEVDLQNLRGKRHRPKG
jgi:MFS superfamily sulfate permease-like transporter